MDGFEAVAGNRRLKACKKLKTNRIPCVVVELDYIVCCELIL
jgi:ParB-like chromosome segregation protein Spo0J